MTAGRRSLPEGVRSMEGLGACGNDMGNHRDDAGLARLEATRQAVTVTEFD